MRKKKRKARFGLTIVELMIAVVLAVIAMFGIGVAMVDSQRGLNSMYNRVYSDVVTGGYVARRTFDSVIRAASKETYLLDQLGAWLEVYYYSDISATSVDRYARFYCDSDGQLKVEYGQLEPRQALTTTTICGNVSNCIFKAAGTSAQMVLTLDDGEQAITVTSSANMHNE